MTIPSNLSNEIEDLYDCSFCDGERKLWNLKTDEYEPCPCIEKLEALTTLFNKQIVAELKAIAPDMRTHPKYKGYVETSASGEWQPLSDRIKELE